MQTNSSVMSEIPEAKLPIVMVSLKKIDSKVPGFIGTSEVMDSPFMLGYYFAVVVNAGTAGQTQQHLGSLGRQVFPANLTSNKQEVGGWYSTWKK